MVSISLKSYRERLSFIIKDERITIDIPFGWDKEQLIFEYTERQYHRFEYTNKYMIKEIVALIKQRKSLRFGNTIIQFKDMVEIVVRGECYIELSYDINEFCKAFIGCLSKLKKDILELKKDILELKNE